METNPYAAPGAVVEDAPAWAEGDIEARKATRWQRWWGNFIDGFIVGICSWPISAWWATHHGMNHAASARMMANFPFTGPSFVMISFVLVLVVISINIALLNGNGQTIGKRAVGTKIVRTDGSEVELWRVIVLRYLPLFFARLIPFIGGLAYLADALVIFGNEKRCIHDYIADTIVIVN
ncbi:RDD family protein [Dyella nitratireducens]|uniref:RDD domain-containing protein n=1 Tax=Dyella nitratireducens TaxID=1849580 RepID=A0ABQ1FZD4_9GAMM|nr:RDD family protein [Dyella nitratireducens]GGA34205.1 hypothetical protein GCM10010981_23960 [Dyella nitratireducens]GLQ40830.1 hypothetical protein GCM10007902_06800 [Dyella nitratireducens]